MARPLRIEYEGALYHVIARGSERRSIVFSKTDYDKFLQYLKETKKKYSPQSSRTLRGVVSKIDNSLSLVRG